MLPLVVAGHGGAARGDGVRARSVAVMRPVSPARVLVLPLSRALLRNQCESIRVLRRERLRADGAALGPVTSVAGEKRALIVPGDREPAVVGESLGG